MSQMSDLDVNQFYQRVFRKIQRIPSVQQVAQVGYIALALSHRPPLFSGEANSIPLEEWQFKMDYIFYQIGCPDNRKVEVAVRFLVGPALQWWRSVEYRAMSDRTGWSWYQFIGELRFHLLMELSPSGRSESIIPKQGKLKDRSEIKCWYCKELGHFRHECERFKLKGRKAKEIKN